MNGQVIVWDCTSTDHKITAGKKSRVDAGGDDDNAPVLEEEDNEKAQNVVKMKHMSQSSIIASHKCFVSDLQFIPPTVKVDKK